MINKYFIILSSILLVSCGGSTNNIKENVFGVFLGADDKALSKITKYEKVCIDIDEFNSSSVSTLKNSGCEIYAYLSIGSLENYRSYYNDYKQYEFFEYENWPDEKWIDVSQTSWQNLLTSEATRFKNLGATGLFMDNFDVYYIASEEYTGDKVNAESIYSACKTILSSLYSLDLKLIVNSGSTFLERLYDEQEYQLLSMINVYCQECVFSSIEDYDLDEFGTQNEEDHNYYLGVISFMKKYASILLLEYSKDDSLIFQIKEYCKTNNIYYYISSHVNLT